MASGERCDNKKPPLRVVVLLHLFCELNVNKMGNNITVSLLGIQTANATHEFDTISDFKQKHPSTIDFDIEITHHLVNPAAHFLSITVTNKFIDPLYPKPVFTLITQSNFGLTCDKILLDVPIKPETLNIFTHFATLSMAHNHGVLSGVTIGTPLFGQNIYSSIPIPQVKDMVRQKMNSKGN